MASTSSHTPAAVLPRHGVTTADRWLASKLFGITAPANISITLWDGSITTAPNAAGAIVLHDRGALIGLLVDPDLRFGELYSEGRIDVRGDLGDVLERLSRATLSDRLSLRERWRLFAERAESVPDARRNIHRHYDLGNDFYRLWLDRDLVYTCAYYAAADATLEEAQTAKLDLVCRKVALRPGDHVIEAGCGWGALALHMARRYGARVRAFNISREQLEFARARAAREGLASRVEFIEDDYRNITGRCDVFMSVGMLEHVGRRNFGALSAVVRRTLDRAAGRGLLHFIGRDHPRPLNEWIRQRIFPGASVPTLSEAISHVVEPAGFSIVDVENLRAHYARTLTDWWDRFERSLPAIRASFDDGFVRAWRLYLAGSRAAFATGWLQLFQVVFAPPGRVLRWTRDDLYCAPKDAA